MTATLVHSCVHVLDASSQLGCWRSNVSFSPNFRLRFVVSVQLFLFFRVSFTSRRLCKETFPDSVSTSIKARMQPRGGRRLWCIHAFGGSGVCRDGGRGQREVWKAALSGEKLLFSSANGRGGCLHTAPQHERTRPHKHLRGLFATSCGCVHVLLLLVSTRAVMTAPLPSLRLPPLLPPSR